MRPLVLSGFMATGKSTVGRSVAQRLKRPFVDLDRLVEDRAGCSISELFRTRGEPAFRALERQALLDVLRDDAVVLSVGGGALLDRGMRLDVLERARVVTLRASAAEVARRSATDTARPLLGATADVHALLELRASSYAECHASVDTEGRDIAAVVADVCGHVDVSLVAVACGRDSYSVQVGAGVTAGALARRDAPGGHLLVTYSNVGALYADQVAEWLGAAGQVHRVVLTPGEEHKSLEGMRSLWAAAAGFGLDRRCHVFSLGGGVVSDMAGVVAATW
nr:shikimate kinase [Polyangiaceae bacterium]